MPRNMPRAKKRALHTDKPLKVVLRARKAARKLTEPEKMIVLEKHPSIPTTPAPFTMMRRRFRDE